jgi:hypothetical protein
LVKQDDLDPELALKEKNDKKENKKLSPEA